MMADTWEERMAALAHSALQGRVRPDSDPMAQWREPDDPEGILPQILAARCLGIAYGDPGPELPGDKCRACYGDRSVWLGNAWGMRHKPGDARLGGLFGCCHPCHDDEAWLAGAPR